ncbi:hypothetical protein ACFQ1S_00275 [Kibdelosporangium lantanae]|uniref:Uncharacterized protein n=1 Tax=Kibdelosporangium lantanae TaxID=1497396 RepID=A0ABW3M0P7_9PSEU
MIDGVTDNEVNTRAEEGDEQFVSIGLSARQAGWDQVMTGPNTRPPDDQIVTVTLTIDQWGLVASSLDIWVSITENSHAPEGAATARLIREAVSTQAGQQLPAWPMPEQPAE